MSDAERLNIDRVLPPEQREVGEFLQKEIFSQIPENHFFLVGGTAIALRYGHRQSIAFDFFSFPVQNEIDSQIKVIDQLFRKHGIYYRKDFELIYGQQHYNINGVGITFMGFQNLQAEHERELYKLPVHPTEKIFGFDTLDIRDLGALKAFARCQRSKMKDVVDIAEMIKNEVPLQEIITTAEQIFGYDFSAKEFLGACLDIDDITSNELDDNIKFLNNKNTDFYTGYLKSELEKFYG